MSTTHTYIIHDPFAGELSERAATPEEAVENAYADIPEEERPKEVTIDGIRYLVPGGSCRPTQ